MPQARLTLATQREIDAISRESHVLWGGGLTPVAYRQLWDEVASTTWARKHARFYVWRDHHGRILSSMKVYRPRLRLLDREGRCSVLGAIYTPRAIRRRGHATDMVRAVLEEVVERQDLAAMLFSDIGIRYYAKFGFRALPAVENTGRLPVRSVGPHAEYGFRPAQASDLAKFQAAHEASSRDRPVAVLRDAEHWEFLWVRSRSFFSRVKDPSIRHRWYTVHRREWNLREIGSVDGDPETMAAIVAHGGAMAYRDGLRRFYGWLPGEVVESLEGWTIRSRPRRRAVPMLLAFDRELVGAEENRQRAVYIPFQDQF
jgi:hypothetical protein